MFRLFLALATFLFVPTGAAWAGDASGLRVQRFAYHPLVLEEMGSGLKPEVQLGGVNK